MRDFTKGALKFLGVLAVALLIAGTILYFFFVRVVTVGHNAMAPTVMLGDFNEWFWPASLRGALGRALPARTRHATYPSWYPLLRLDRASRRSVR
mgnify:CR=1 FL=1